ARQAGLQLNAKDIFRHQTIAELDIHIDPVSATVREPVRGPAPLTPIQRWFVESGTTDVNHYTMTTLVELPADTDENALSQALNTVVAHHDALRMRFTHTGQTWRQDTATAEPADLLWRCDDPDLDQAAIQAQTSLNITDGPLLRAILCTGEHPRLLITAHHLVIDGVSWRILLDDLQTAYQQIHTGQPAHLEPERSGFKDWAQTLTEQVEAGRFNDDLSYWARTSDAATALPVDRTGRNTAGSVRTIQARLDRDTTNALLREIPAVYRTQINDVLLSALGRVLTQWTGNNRVLIGMEGHGREDITNDLDLTRTIGWFTTEYPLTLALPTDTDWGQTLKSVKEQLRAIPHHGLSYGALRHLSPPQTPAAALRNDPTPQITFNYHGHWHNGTPEGPFHIHHTDIGHDTATDTIRDSLIDIIGIIHDGELTLNWAYSTNHHNHTTINRLATHTITALHEIITHCTQPDTGGHTPSDYPLTTLDQTTLDQINPNIDDIYPLTPLQAGMVFHSLLDANSDTYLDQICMRISGVSNPRAL
ncbi:MAG: non-ribosomal peptide synthetase, partial [Mycobacterium sp.]|nr:non-ribosomal peptide synthetase [Mycobacterium sp.]